MRFTKVIVAAAFVFTMTAGALLAADDSFSYGGYGRIGTASYSSLNGTNGGFGTSKAGRLGAEGETNYFEQAFSKKWTADGGAWAKMTFTMGYFNGSNNGDEGALSWNLRQFYAEMGGIQLLPAGATIWAGQRYYGRKDVHNYDLFYTNFSGIGFGIENLANGMFSIAYIGQGSGTAVQDKGAELYLHNVAVTVKVPSMATIDAVFGYSKGGKVDAVDNGYKIDQDPDSATYGTLIPDTAAAYEAKSQSTFLLSALITPPVAGLNVVAQFAKGAYADGMFNRDYMSMIRSAGENALASEKIKKNTLFRVIATTSTDVADGITINPAVEFAQYTDKTGAKAVKTTQSYGFVRAIIKLSQNLAFQGNIGYSWNKTDVSGAKAERIVQVVPALVVALDPGYWTRPQIRFYGFYQSVDKDHKTTAVDPKGKTSKMGWGCQMEAWW